MNAVDTSEQYDSSHDDPAPSLLAIILDTNPHAWALLQDTLPLSTAVANLLVFINAHLACNYANKVAVVASHSQEAKWLYPTPATNTTNADADGDIDMNGSGEPSTDADTDSLPQTSKYRPFRIVEEQLTRNLKELLASSTAEEVRSSTSTMMAGALTLGLSHINRETIAYAEAHGTAKQDTDPSSSAQATITSSGLPPPPGTTSGPAHSSSDLNPTGLQSRILIISVSSSADSAHQYIPIMNSIFACQRLRIPIDICKLTGDAVFLQQACDATRGIYMSLSSPRGLLQYLMLAFLPDQRSRRHLITPTHVDVDFRAACFCHRRVVDVGFVCSICLSIFCEPPKGADCLTCGAHLELGDYGSKPVVVARKRKRKKGAGKSGVGPANGLSSGTATPTPTPTPTPMR